MLSVIPPIEKLCNFWTPVVDPSFMCTQQQLDGTPDSWAVWKVQRSDDFEYCAVCAQNLVHHFNLCKYECTHLITPAFSQTVVQHQGQRSNTSTCLRGGEQRFGTFSGLQPLSKDKTYRQSTQETSRTCIDTQGHSTRWHHAHRLGLKRVFQAKWQVTCSLLSVFF